MTKNEKEPTYTTRRTRKAWGKLAKKEAGGRVSYRRYKAEKAVHDAGTALWRIGNRVASNVASNGTPCANCGEGMKVEGNKYTCPHCGRKVNVVNGQKSILFPGR